MNGECCADADSVNRLLCTGPELKELYISNNAKGDHDVGWLDTKVVVYTERVCSNLEVFRCEIGNIPRPDITRRVLDYPASEFVRSGTLEESIISQRRIYSKFPRLTKLQQLTLGFVFNPGYNHYQQAIQDYCRHFDCLTMMVYSGLGLFKDFKELRAVYLN